MTRKRFVKLLMSKGYSRNSANEMTVLAQFNEKSYEEVYAMIPSFQRLTDAVRNMSEVMENIGDFAERIAKALSEWFCKFNEALQNIQLTHTGTAADGCVETE